MDKLLNFLDKKIVLPAYIFILTPLIAYFFWELYWCIEVGYPFIKWHTHLMPFIYLGICSLLISLFLTRRYGSQAGHKFLLVSVSILFALFVAEAFLTVTGRLKVYMEQVSGAYYSPYTPMDKNYYHLWAPNVPHWLRKPEYTFYRPTNSLGFADEEWHIPPASERKSILALGDSFTEGDGAPYDSSYVSLLRGLLLAQGDSSYVMNGGICGSDPFNNYIILKDLLPHYKTDIIIQSLGSGDMNDDILLRGGLERFQSDGTVKYHPHPFWEPVYAVSYISRPFFHMAGYDQILRKSKITKVEKDRVDLCVCELFKDYAALCRKRGIRLFIVLHPARDEVENNKYNYDFSVVSQYANSLNIPVLDLLPAYRAEIDSSRTTAADYFWKHDGHHNAKGYKMMANATWQAIAPFLPQEK